MGKKTNAFTMAEILISLTIIGVIAALTLPALMANLNEKVWNTKRKALHSRMAQALAAMPNLDKYLATEDITAEYNFIQNGLATAFNITKICDQGNKSKCDINLPQFDMNDVALDLPRSAYNHASFNTVNGESVLVWRYNSSCNGESNADFMTSSNVTNMICASFLYDLNGNSKGPNKFGKDMGLIVAYFPEYPLVIAPMPVAATEDEVSADEADDLLASNPDYRLPSLAEAVAIVQNKSLIGDFIGDTLDTRIWTDNGVMCNTDNCIKADDGSKAGESSAYLVLVSKNGDAPKKFTKLEKSKEEIKECPDKQPGCKNVYCDNKTGEWVCP